MTREQFNKEKALNVMELILKASSLNLDIKMAQMDGDLAMMIMKRTALVVTISRIELIKAQSYEHFNNREAA